MHHNRIVSAYVQFTIVVALLVRLDLFVRSLTSGTHGAQLSDCQSADIIGIISHNRAALFQ